MERKLICLLIIVVTVLTSCEKILELKPESSLGYGSFWNSEDGAKAAQVALHANLRNYYSNLWYLGEIRSDIWGGNTIETCFDLEVIQQDISTTKVPSFAQNWAGFYTYLHLVNDIIKNVPDVPFTNEKNKNYLLGQAYGIRAFIYYTMLRTWGDVPIVLEPTTKIDFDNLYIPRSPVSEVMKQIKGDIEKSLEYFGDDNTFLNNKRIYWSKAATLTLKGDVYIWSGTHMNGGNEDYITATQSLQSVINQTSTFQLLPKFADVFSYTNKNNKEIIFALSYEIDQASNIFGNFTARKNDILNLYTRDGGTTTNIVVNGGNRNGPSTELLTKWNDFDDTRNDATFIRLYKNPNGTNYVASLLRKFWGTVNLGSQVMADDVPIYRFADVILLMAEAKNLLGEDPSYYINLIRQRAYGNKFPGHEYVNGTKEQNIAVILDERLYEFIAEGKRWWDLRRAGDNWVFANNKYLNPATDAYKLLYPLTRDMLGRNPLLTQTPGYED
ncbi:MAG TPA: RagB/SusD family nutrient uptake outer membrane protein [Bacteroidales bacterium]|nr:RagB/SusD family nutrient uptake outer membrane protein [Bacteroidales bacterium]